MLSRMTVWMTFIGVVIAAGLAAAAQFLANRGEPAAIKRIALLNEAIAGIAEDVPAKRALIGARNKLVATLSASLLDRQGFARVLRVAGWIALGVGLAELVLSIIVPSIFNTVSESWPLWFGASQLGFGLVIGGPVLLIYAAIWPGLVADIRGIRAQIAGRGYRKIRKALTVDIVDDHRPDARVPSTVAG